MEENKVVSIEDRIPKLKKLRKKKANRRLLFYLSIFFFLISIIVYLQSPLSYIKTIDITGYDVMTEEEILQRSELTLSTNIWEVRKSDIEKKILEHPLIKQVEVTRQLPQTINIKVDEYKIIGFVKEGNQYLPLLSNGVQPNLVDTSLDISEAPVLKNFTDDSYLERMIEELNKVEETVFHLISEIIWEPTEKNKYKVKLYMNDGFIVEATIRNFAIRMESYPTIVAQIEPGVKGIVHMGVGTYFEKIDE